MNEQPQPNAPKSGVTKIQVQPGSKKHDIIVEENAEHPEPPPVVERRKSAPPVNVQVGSATNGLVGWPATIANMSAVGFVLVLLLFMYRDFSTSVKEERAASREENRLIREQNDRANVAITDAINRQTTAMQMQSRTFDNTLASLQTKLDATILSTNALMVEFKKMIEELTALLKKKG